MRRRGKKTIEEYAGYTMAYIVQTAEDTYKVKGLYKANRLNEIDELTQGNSFTIEEYVTAYNEDKLPKIGYLVLV